MLFFKMKYITVIVFTFVSLSCFAQKNIYKGFPSLIWPKLYDIEFVDQPGLTGDFQKPIFSSATKALEGKKISLPGYMVPFETGLRGTHFMFSSMPLNACFFCGVGGPETVVDVFMKESTNFYDKPVEITGTLRLNSNNPDKMIYILENAEVIGEVE
jgi:hypothetical protein